MALSKSTEVVFCAYPNPDQKMQTTPAKAHATRQGLEPGAVALARQRISRVFKNVSIAEICSFLLLISALFGAYCKSAVSPQKLPRWMQPLLAHGSVPASAWSWDQMPRVIWPMNASWISRSAEDE